MTTSSYSVLYLMILVLLGLIVFFLAVIVVVVLLKRPKPEPRGFDVRFPTKDSPDATGG